MNIKINTNISSEFQEPSITIQAPKLSTEIQNVIDYISNINTTPTQIVGNQNNQIYFIDIEDVVCFFSKDKYNYARTMKGTYKIKYKLYELEETLKPKDFIRISNSCLINIRTS